MSSGKALDFSSERILDAVDDGVYVTDKERRIVFWNDAAERITGYPREEVLGKSCRENILCHIDKEGRFLCGEEHCPLHRSMVTDRRSDSPMIVFGLNRDKKRVPMQVTVSPIRDENGEVVGGVESFRDMSAHMDDLERARRVQQHTLQRYLPEDPRIRFEARYTPCDVIGGDFYAITDIGPDRYSVFLADVMGHGMASALHSMFLRTLWEEHRELLGRPRDFLSMVNERLHPLVEEDNAFATMVLLVVDLAEDRLTWSGAGHTNPLLFTASGKPQALDAGGLPGGMMPSAVYAEQSCEFPAGATLLTYTDAAIEVPMADGEELGEEGLLEMLRALEYPGNGHLLAKLEAELLRLSNVIRLPDDLTLLQCSRP